MNKANMSCENGLNRTESVSRGKMAQIEIKLQALKKSI